MAALWSAAVVSLEDAVSALNAACGIPVVMICFLSLQTNDPHHGAAGVDVDFKTDWPPPLPCMRWFAVAFELTRDNNHEIHVMSLATTDH